MSSIAKISTSLRVCIILRLGLQEAEKLSYALSTGAKFRYVVLSANLTTPIRSSASSGSASRASTLASSSSPSRKQTAKRNNYWANVALSGRGFLGIHCSVPSHVVSSAKATGARQNRALLMETNSTTSARLIASARGCPNSGTKARYTTAPSQFVFSEMALCRASHVPPCYTLKAAVSCAQSPFASTPL